MDLRLQFPEFDDRPVETNSIDTILAQATFTYDALDNRIGIDENGMQTWTLYDGNGPDHGLQQFRFLGTWYLNGPDGD